MQVVVELDVSGAGERYPSDLTDEQWALVEPLLPALRTGPKGGRREKHPRRRTVDAIMYVVRTGCAWRQLPHDFPPWQTVYWYFVRWHNEGTVTRIHDALRDQVRRGEGRNVEPTAGLIDSQSIRTADTVPADTRGFDAGKKVKGRKRFIVTDTLGLLLTVHVMAASIQDRDGAKRSLLWTRLDHPTVLKVWADQGFAGRLVDWAAKTLNRMVEIVRKKPGQRGFQVQPKRWAVECTFAWLTSHRRLARDYEHHTTHAETMIRWAMISVIVRRLTRGRPARRQGPRPLGRTARGGAAR
ncbi:IS5 family transposase [Streptomyces sp. NBC_00199]|uniref:IS5 family transposase n=1 Tax=Streptomyces sp. NBC_00199 TaxID=2975678 RepID=UPI00225820FE|nr:IS5 family transposase [Streptomyces sp. NBC_00199]MCX5262432.1 IS5 family transposase [Streptomyces sp. NBC_00199]